MEVFCGRITDPAVDADDSTVHVERWAARVIELRCSRFGVPRCEPDNAPAKHHRPLGIEASGMSKRENPVSQTGLIEVAHLNMGPGAVLRDLHHASVDLVIGAERFAMRGSAVGKNKMHISIRFIADMSGREHNTIFGDHDTAASGFTDLYGDNRG